MKYILSTKEDKVLIEANSREDAFRNYFHSLKKITLDKLGQIVVLKDEDGEEYPFRTVPALVLLGLMNFNSGILNVAEITGCSIGESEDLLLRAMEQDKWIINTEG